MDTVTGRVMRRGALAVALATALGWAGAGSAMALSSPITIGSTAGAPAVAVDSSGTAYAAWPISGSVIDFCKLALGATGCTPVQLTTTGLNYFGTPSVLVDGSDVYVFADSNGAPSQQLTGLDEYLSTNGGTTFGLVSNAVSDTGGYEPEGLVALTGGDFGVTWNYGGGGNPSFQANSLASPQNYSEATFGTAADPYAALDPSPDSYALFDSSGALGSLTTGADSGVLGVFTANSYAGPCASTTDDGLEFSFASLPASTTALNTGSDVTGTAWSPLASINCTGSSPAVGAGPSGYGVLDFNNQAQETQYQSFTPPSTFGTPVSLAGDGDGTPSLSQDGAGGIYATWDGFYTGIRLAYSGNGGKTFTVNTLNAAATDGDSASAVDASGQGWVVYTDGHTGTELAQPFVKTDAIPPAVSTTITTTQIAGTKSGPAISIAAGTVGETDKATIGGTNAGFAGGTVHYYLYASKSCDPGTSEVFDGGSQPVVDGVAAPSNPVTAALSAGKYYWQAIYSGDPSNDGSTSTCGTDGEVLTVTPAATIGVTVTSNGKTVSLPVTCASVPCSGTLSLTADPPASHAKDAREAKVKIVTLASGKFKIRRKGRNTIKLKLTGKGKGLLAKDHYKLSATVTVTEKIGGHKVLTVSKVKIRR
jgi:hypothetical protein